MRPFNIQGELDSLREIYPAAADLSRICSSGDGQVRMAVARLWLSEGIPFAFRESPALYEQVRTWLASRLGVDPKEITIVGSARLGQSLDPKRLGMPFSSASDLDLTTVSLSLFDRLVGDFNAWTADYEAGAVHPGNSRERHFWDENLERGPSLIGRGFMDSKLVPRRERYGCACLIGQTMYLLCEKLRVTPRAPSVSKADIRAYRDWGSYARQMAVSLR
jgi:hypothetical protein